MKKYLYASMSLFISLISELSANNQQIPTFIDPNLFNQNPASPRDDDDKEYQEKWEEKRREEIKFQQKQDDDKWLREHEEERRNQD